MPRNGSGIYSVPAGTAAVSLQPIASVPYNGFLTDISSEITNSLPTTGVKAMGANLPMGGNKIINMADPSVSTDAATKNYVDNITHGKIVAIQILTVTGTYTRSTNATQGDIYVVGGGGAGGGGPATGAGQFGMGGGGGSGALTIKFNVALPATASFTIGAAGAGVSGGTGGSGGQTSFNATYTANGGTGGAAGGPAGAVFIVAGGAAGTAGATGDVNSTGNGGTLAAVGNSGLAAGIAGSSVLYGYGRGGQGAAVGPSSGALAGSPGIAGAIIVIERT